MKKILFLVLLFGYHFCIFPQCFDLYVQTPNGSNVKACTSGGYSQATVAAADAYTRTFAISANNVYDSGTNSYNCHGYAWNVSAGTTITWSVSENANIVSGQGTNTVTVSFCTDYEATVTATLYGTVNQVLTKNIYIDWGIVKIESNIGYFAVTLSLPDATHYDWDYSNNLIAHYGGPSPVNCTSDSTMNFTPAVNSGFGTILVRGRNGDCVSDWQYVSLPLVHPEIDNTRSYFNPYGFEPMYAELEENGIFNAGNVQGYFRWYFDDELAGVTYEPYFQTYEWPCGMHSFSVRAVINEIETLPSTYTDFWGMCFSPSSLASWKPPFPKPASKELVVKH
jgi:hypothetical protein